MERIFSKTNCSGFMTFASRFLLRNCGARVNGCAVALYHSHNKGVYGHNHKITVQMTSQNDNDKHLADKNRSNWSNFYRLVNAYREHGHRAAHINLLENSNDNNRNVEVAEINGDRYFLGDSFSPAGLVHWTEVQGSDTVPTAKGIELLKQTYASTTAFEFMYIEDEAEREWFSRRVEQLVSEEIDDAYKKRIALEMAKSQNFDNFLAKKFQTVKRYGGEGCETMVAFYLELIKSAEENGVDHIILGMAHRGRLNLLTGLLNFPPVQMFQKMKGLPEFPPEARASGDVLSHLFTTTDVAVGGGGGKTVRVSLLPNPSHLEAVNPVAAGKARAKLKTLKDYDYKEESDGGFSSKPSRVLCVQVHGDAAVAGQGIIQETLGFANVPHFRVGGSIHLVINNQLGYTTPGERGRSSRYTSDVAKMIAAPVIHVNGDYPQDLVKATKLALEYRRTFHKDIFIDLVCFRRWGHNELDDPTFTNPQLYQLIHQRRSVPDIYCDNLIGEGILDKGALEETLSSHNRWLDENLSKVEGSKPEAAYLKGLWSQISQPAEEISTWDTGVDVPLLKYIGMKSVTYPQDFSVHPHLAKMFIKNRIGRIHAGDKIDWATAEALAFGSLLYQGFGVRLSGEDVGRGTFSQRHAMLVDQKSGDIIVPLNHILDNQEEKLEVCNSTLSEEAVLGFEYGFSLESPNNLVIWEAQFGDFFNGAQIQIDTLLGSGETKWMLQSGLVMLLPHGMDGAGPEHSSCRIERFLQLTDSNEDSKVDGDYNNLQVVNPTTPAQYFHLLRRQVLRNFRKPLVVAGPKILLRLPAATSCLEDMGTNTHFHPVLDDELAAGNAGSVKKLLLVSGRHYYALHERRVQLGLKDVAIVRLESLCPFPVLHLQKILSKYKNVSEVTWSQEEHQNMGAWSFVKPRFENFVGKKIKYVGRGPLAAPAVGVGKVHQQEMEQIMKDTFS